MSLQIRRAAWLAGAPARFVLIVAIRAYRLALSPMLGGQCRFWPTCSRYAEDAIRNVGASRGVALAAWRVLRCSPLSKGGDEPAPEPPAWRRHVYDGVIQSRAGVTVVQR